MKMSLSDKLQFRSIGIVVLLSIFTGAILKLSYEEYVLQYWQWKRDSVILSVLTCLWAFTFELYSSAHDDRESAGLSFFIILILPLTFILVYPGTSRLHIDSDGNAEMVIIG